MIRTKAEYERGSLSVTALMLIFFFSAILSGGVYLGVNVFRSARAITPPIESIQLADSIAMAIIETFREDDSPNSDGPALVTDRIVSELTERTDEDVSVHIEDLSSRINPNAIRKQMIDETTLSRFILPESSTEAMQQVRFDEGISLDLVRLYGPILRIEEHPELFTGYGLFNVNTTDEFILEQIVGARTGSESAAREFRLAVQSAVSRMSLISSNTLSLMISAQTDLWPIITAAPQWNVHFLPREILEAILAYEPFGISYAEQKAELLVEMRNSTEIDPLALASILEVEDSHRILQYIGTQTWFWKIRIDMDEMTAFYVILSSPDEEPFATQRTHMIIERFFDYNGEEP